LQLALLVGLGGFVGSLSRYLLSGWVQRLGKDAWFPWGTLSVNILGCLFIGVLAGLAESRGILTPQTRAFLLIGLLGGFTTFSSFSYETTTMFQNGQALAAIANIALQVVLGIGVTLISYNLVQKI
jgi:CrcB protein